MGNNVDGQKEHCCSLEKCQNQCFVTLKKCQNQSKITLENVQSKSRGDEDA